MVARDILSREPSLLLDREFVELDYFWIAIVGKLVPEIFNH